MVVVEVEDDGGLVALDDPDSRALPIEISKSFISLYLSGMRLGLPCRVPHDGFIELVRIRSPLVAFTCTVSWLRRSSTEVAAY